MIKSYSDVSADFAGKMDREDPLKVFRDQFYIPDQNTIYLDGNSLGRLPRKTRDIITHHTDNQWGDKLIQSWNEDWYDLPERLGKKFAPIIGAHENEVIVCDSTSINLYKLAWAALNYQSGRTKIVSDDLNFPTDLYVIQGIVDQLGQDYSLEVVKSHDDRTMDINLLENAIDDNTAVVVLSHVAFKSAFLYNMEAVTKLAHKKGALVIWDLSHSAGAVPVELNNCGADLAIGCTYKYLNGGPGSPAFLYVNSNLQNKLKSPVWAWFGDADPFAFNLEYEASRSIKKFLIGTPPVLSMQAIEPGLDMILDAGINNIRGKSIQQSEYLIFLHQRLLEPLGFQLGSPLESKWRGSHISIQHPEGYRICKAMINPPDVSFNVIPDFREPDNIRIGITPLYTTYKEIFTTIKRIREIAANKIYVSFSIKREAVT